MKILVILSIMVQTITKAVRYEIIPLDAGRLAGLTLTTVIAKLLLIA